MSEKAKDVEPALRPRRVWEAWFKRQSCDNKGWIAHAEWRRKMGIIRMDRNGMCTDRIE